MYVLPETDKTNKSYLRNTKLQLWGAVALAGIFIMLTGSFIAFLLSPVYLISVYATIRYTASRFMHPSSRKAYLKASYTGLGLIVFMSIFIAVVNPTSEYRTDRNPAYVKVPNSSYTNALREREVRLNDLGNTLQNNRP